jgi:hypothetical protein
MVIFLMILNSNEGKDFCFFFFWIITKFKDFENINEGRKTKLKWLII